MHNIIIEDKQGIQVLKMDQTLIKCQSDMDGIINLLPEIHETDSKFKQSPT